MRASSFILIAVVVLINADASASKSTGKLRESKAKKLDLSSKNYRNEIRQGDAVTYELGVPEYQILNPHDEPEIITEDHPQYLENLKKYGQKDKVEHNANNDTSRQTTEEKEQQQQQKQESTSVLTSLKPSEISYSSGKYQEEISTSSPAPKLTEAVEKNIQNSKFVVVKQNSKPTSDISSETNTATRESTTSPEPTFFMNNKLLADNPAYVIDSVGAYTDQQYPQFTPVVQNQLDYLPNNRIPSNALPYQRPYAYPPAVIYTPQLPQPQTASYPAQIPQYEASYQQEQQLASTVPFATMAGAPVTQYSSMSHPSNPFSSPFVYYHFNSNNRNEDLPHLQDFEQLYRSAVKMPNTPSGMQYQHVI